MNINCSIILECRVCVANAIDAHQTMEQCLLTEFSLVSDSNKYIIDPCANQLDITCDACVKIVYCGWYFDCNVSVFANEK